MDEGQPVPYVGESREQYQKAQKGQPVPYSDLSASTQVMVDMITLARAAPSPYWLSSSYGSLPEHSTYICQDGAEETRRTFLFVP